MVVFFVINSDFLFLGVSFIIIAGFSLLVSGFLSSEKLALLVLGDGFGVFGWVSWIRYFWIGCCLPEP